MEETRPTSPSYREVLHAHRRLFAVPVVLAAVIALWAAATAPKMYRSGATLWSDSAGSSSAMFGATPPAAQDQQLLNELLTTRYFEQQVARTSPLGAYLADHPTDAGGPSGLIAKLRGPQSLADRLAAALSAKRVTSEAKGPHVLEVNYDAPTPELAYKTLQAIVAQFREQRGALREDALENAQKQVDAASATLATARTKLTQYLTAHPAAGRDDPQLQQLAIAEREAVGTLTNATDTMNEATVAVANGATSETVLRVIDKPQLPTAPTAGKRKVVTTVVAGLFAGGVVSGLGLVLLTRRRRRELAAGADGRARPGGIAPKLEPAE